MAEPQAAPVPQPELEPRQEPHSEPVVEPEPTLVAEPELTDPSTYSDNDSPETPDYTTPETPKKSKKWIYLFIGAGVLCLISVLLGLIALGIVGYLYWRSKKKAD
jgi:hypothetical protein